MTAPTPSDAEVRGRYCDGVYLQTGHRTEGEDSDRWLTRHDAEIRRAEQQQQQQQEEAEEEADPLDESDHRPRHPVGAHLIAAKALRDFAEFVMGPSPDMQDAATCRSIALAAEALARRIERAES